MKKDWSALKITVLLYFIVMLIPINYYFAKESFRSTQNDASVMNHLVFIGGAVPALATTENSDKNSRLIKEIDSSLEAIEKNYINFPPNKEYVSLLRADKIFNSLKQSYKELKESLNDSQALRVHSNKIAGDINAFSTTAQEMMTYKINTILDTLYISLAFTMLLIVILIFFIRTYIRLQFLKHTIHDHLTGLYNKEYFESVLENAKLLVARENRPLSLLMLSINNYEELNKSLSKTDFEKHIKKFSTVFSHFFRHSDTVCRIEENCFVSITPDASLANIKKLSLRLEQELQSKLSSSTIRLNISIGVATHEENGSFSLIEESKKNMQDNPAIKLGDAL